MRYAFYIGFFIALCLAGVGFALVLLGLSGCETPYGTLGVGVIDDYIAASDDLVCLSDGFDEICIKTVPGSDGRDGRDGRDGAVVLLEVEKIVIEKVIETEREVFVLEVRRTEMRYETPLGEIYVPEDAPIVAPADVKVTPVMDVPASVNVPAVDMRVPDVPSAVIDRPVPDVSPAVDVPVQERSNPPTFSTPVVDPNAIWHVMYRNDGGRLTLYVYPRERDIQSVPPFAISDQFLDEIQGTREQVNWILERTLSENNAVLGAVGGVQGVVN